MFFKIIVFESNMKRMAHNVALQTIYGLIIEKFFYL